ncbi:MAG: Holliday junction resolvase RuvX [Chloroflexi bacterium]|nr:Holliday junction resolvase RuvX [Chloroflexota bacterium]
MVSYDEGKEKRLMALDMGQRRIGIALSDPSGFMASPLIVLERKGEDADIAAIQKLVTEHSVARVVVGLPLSMDGSMGAEAERVLQFCSRLSQQLPVPVETWDERLSTVAAQGLMIEAGASQRHRRAWRDAVAAAIILQGYLDRERNRAQ